MTSNSQNEELLQPISQDSAKEDETGITLYGFRPRFGVPSVRPFDMKTEVQLQMMGPKYRKISANMTVHRKSRLHYIDDNGTVAANSTFIRFFLEEKYSKDLDHGLSDSQRASA